MHPLVVPDFISMRVLCFAGSSHDSIRPRARRSTYCCLEEGEEPSRVAAIPQTREGLEGGGLAQLHQLVAGPLFQESKRPPFREFEEEDRNKSIPVLF